MSSPTHRGGDTRARQNGHDFLYRMRPADRWAIADIDYLEEWNAAEKALTGVEARDPTADIGAVTIASAFPLKNILGSTRTVP